MSRLTSATFLTVFLFVGALPECRGDVPERWFFAYVDLLNSKTCCPARDNSSCSFGTQDMIDLIPRLSDAGYSVVVLSNYHLASKSHLDGSHKDSCRFFENLGKIADAAEASGIELIPEIMVVGASGSVLANDPHLAEGAPVCNCKLKVKRNADGQLIAEIADPSNRIKQGDLDGELNVLEKDWKIIQSNLLLTPSPSTPEPRGRSLSIMPSAGIGDLGLTQELTLKPRHQYELTFQIKTSGMQIQDGDPGFYVLLSIEDKDVQREKGPYLTNVSHQVAETQDWTKYYVNFNTFQYSKVTINVGLEGIESGELNLDSLKIREVAGVNLLRRDGCPITLASQDGVCYVEGADFRPWIDPLMGLEGQYLHYFADENEEPIDGGMPIVVSGPHIQEGDELNLSYYHAVLPNAAAHRVCCSLRHPKVLSLFEYQVKRLNEFLAPKRWLLMHDEIRSMGHDKLARGDSPAKILGEHLKWSIQSIRELDPDGQIVLVSDMYDPFHNALPTSNEHSYFPLVSGTFCKSWDYIPRGTTIWNWALGEGNHHDLPDVNGSLDHFNALGCDQVVAGFYDYTDRFTDDDEKRLELKKLTRELFCRARKYPRVKAVCYYTTKGNTDYIKDFAETASDVWTADPAPNCDVVLPQSPCAPQ